MGHVLSVRAEASTHLLNQTLGLHRAQRGAAAVTTRRSRLGSPRFDGVQTHRQATLLRLISITEAFCVDRLLDLAEAEVAPSGNNVRMVVWDKASTGAVGTWPTMQDTYKSWFNIRPTWTEINRLLEVRNAVAHGLGALTRVQRVKRVPTIAKITQAGIAVVGDRITLEEVDLQNARNTCRDLIAEVDAAIAAL